MLIIEDYPNLLKQMEKSVSGLDLCIRTATCGQDARSIFAESHFEIVCTDIMLPDCNGLDLIEEICHQHSDVSVIVATALDSPEIRSRAESLGVKMLFVKPFRLAEFKETVQSLQLAPPLAAQKLNLTSCEEL